MVNKRLHLCDESILFAFLVSGYARGAMYKRFRFINAFVMNTFMKYIAKILPLLMAAFLSLSSCVSVLPLPARMSNVVEYVDATESMSDEEWEYVKEEYYLLTDEFRANISSYTEEEKQEVYALMGKMNGIIAKREASKVMGRLNEIVESVPSLLDGFVEGLTDGEY